MGGCAALPKGSAGLARQVEETLEKSGGPGPQIHSCCTCTRPRAPDCCPAARFWTGLSFCHHPGPKTSLVPRGAPRPIPMPPSPRLPPLGISSTPEATGTSVSLQLLHRVLVQDFEGGRWEHSQGLSNSSLQQIHSEGLLRPITYSFCKSEVEPENWPF